jgi:NAD(P)-dependent dehydrogenase (short-subunit alcohol dehydrogenase family)
LTETTEKRAPVAVVTGGGSGIGRASALAFAATGAFVLVSDVDDAGGAETVSLIGSAHSMFVHTDVRLEQDVAELFAVADRQGVLRAVHNNAGITMSDALLHELPIEVWDTIIAVNLRGVFLVLQQAIALARAQGAAVSIVNTASVAGVAAAVGRSAYSTSKAGVIMLTKAAALENGPVGIRVNAVAPGTILTPMVVNNPPGGVPLAGPPPSGRLGSPEEVAAAVVWLCSDAASYVNGACLTVDGGWTAALPARGT